MIEHEYIELTHENKTAIGETFRKARRGTETTGRHIANQFLFSLSYLYKFEKGEVAHYPNGMELTKLAITLGIPFEEMFRNCSTTCTHELGPYNFLSIKEHLEYYKQLTTVPVDTIPALSTEDHLKLAINPTVAQILSDMKDVHKSMQRLEASMTYILRAVYSNSVGLPMPDKPNLDEEKF